jgi:hypothetical protein
MNDPTDLAVIELERRFPDFQVWRVMTWSGLSGGTYWRARRWDGTGDVINVESREQLEQVLRTATS